MPASTWSGALYTHLVAVYFSGEEGENDDVDGSSGVMSSSAPALRVSCVVVSAPTEHVKNRRGGTGESGTTLGSCLRSAVPRVIQGLRVPRNSQSTLGRDNSVLRYSFEGVNQRMFEVPEHHNLRTYCHRARLEGEAVWRKSRADASRARAVALANARD